MEVVERTQEKSLVSGSRPPPGHKKKRAGTKAHGAALRARSEENERRWAAVLVSPTPGWNQSTFSVLHARSGENKNERLCFSSPLPAGTRAHFSVLHARIEKKGVEPNKRVFLSCARAVKKRKMGCFASFPPLPAGTKAHFPALHARSGVNKNKRLCFCPPRPPGCR